MLVSKHFYIAILPFLFLIAIFTASGSDGFKIKFRINGLKDTVCLVANYYGNGTYIKDTLPVDINGRCTFEASSDLPKGVYIFVITGNNYFDFVINNDRKFTMETDVTDPVNRMKITGSPENQEFYNYLQYNQEKFVEIQALQENMKRLESNHDSTEVITRQITALNDTLIAYKLALVKERPDSFLAMLINAMKEPVIPEIPLLVNGRQDSTFAYRYYKNHFWDDMDLTDNRLIRTPVFHNKLKKYFDQVVVQQPDSIIREADILIERTRQDPEMFKYIVWFLTYHYENSEIMGLDKVWVHLVDTYYITGQVTWISAPVMEQIVKKANRIRPLLIGNIAPNMIMMDTSGQLVSMYAIKSDYLLLVFWDPDCGHCEKEIPELTEIYDKYKEAYNLEIFAVCSDTSITKWKEYIIKKKMRWINVDGPRTVTGDYHEQYDVQTTPVIYILDRDKKIIAKRLQTGQIDLFLKNYRKRLN